MKRLVLLALILTSGLKAQHFVGLPDSNAIWTNSYSELVTQPFFHMELVHTVKLCLSNQDTTIQSQNYHQLFLCGSSQVYFAAIREDAGRVYLLPKDSASEITVYDYNLLPGDTVKNIYSVGFGNYWPQQPIVYLALGDPMDPVIVNSVDTVYSSLGAHRILDFGLSGIWIEGIGNSQGFLWDPYPNISNFEIKLECMSIGDSTYYDGYSRQPLAQALNGACDLSLSVDEAMAEEQMSPYPNPSKGKIQFHNQEPMDIKVFNSLGQIVFEQRILSRATLDLSRLSPGQYIVQAGEQKNIWIKE